MAGKFAGRNLGICKDAMAAATLAKN